MLLYEEKNMIVTYEMAYVEVLAVLRNYLSSEEFSKIPQEKIEFFEKYKDKNYIFELNKELPIEKQNISKKANAILVILYRDYFADKNQKEILKQILELNDKIQEKDKQNNKEKYNIIFKNKNIYENTKNSIKAEESLIEIKNEKWNKKLFDFFKNMIIRK